MKVGEQAAGHSPAAGAARIAWPRRVPAHTAAALKSGVSPAVRRALPAAAWAVCGLALLAALLRISLGSPTIADGANPELQAWDMLHGHVLLHGWIAADANYYTLELPLYALSEAAFGLRDLAGHVGSALTYLIVAACAVAVACTGSRGAAVAARSGVVIAVLASPLVMRQGVAVLVEEPDHIGTAAFLLGAFLLIDRAPGWRFTGPLTGVILWIGQVGDATVRYLAVPAILLVAGYRVLAARKIRSTGTAIAAAAAASVPLSMLTRSLMQHAGAYATVQPPSAIAPVGQWPRHLAVALHALLTLFGVLFPARATALSVAAAIFGLACLMAAAFGFAKSVLQWRSASWAEQLLCVTIVINLAVYVASGLPNLHNSRGDRRGASLRRGPRGAGPGACQCTARPGAARDSGPGRGAAAGRRGCPASRRSTGGSAGRLAQRARAPVRPGWVLGRVTGRAGIGRPGSGSRGHPQGRRLPRLRLGDESRLVQPVPA